MKSVLTAILLLTVTVGAATARLRFLVSILFARGAKGWRIAALLTTAEKP